ncbi:MAG TPA: hypothetical protein ENK18_19690, partial [Deltaproteobacteria bacterium]|nr:hypothetical protein [Deltaproteobacteria bacterium]
MMGLISVILSGCGGLPASDKVDAISAVRSAFDERIQSGAVGVEVLGKGVWYSSDTLNSGCLLSKQWAFRGRGGG